jgi:hypothetical protein
MTRGRIINMTTYPSSVPSGCGNWYVSWAPRSISNSAKRTKEQWWELTPMSSLAQAQVLGSGEREYEHEQIIECGKSSVMVTKL